MASAKAAAKRGGIYQYQARETSMAAATAGMAAM